jgi:hypothetical protein
MHVKMRCQAVDEYLNAMLFRVLGNARGTLEDWREDCNWAQTTCSNAQPQPMEFLHGKEIDKAVSGHLLANGRDLYQSTWEMSVSLYRTVDRDGQTFEFMLLTALAA